MPPPRRQDLTARTRRYAVRLLGYACELRAAGRLPPRVVEQLAAAGTAVGANLSESAAHAISRRQMTQAYLVALREAREAWYWLDVVRQVHDPAPTESAWLLQETHEYIAILTVSVRNLRFPRAQD